MRRAMAAGNTASRSLVAVKMTLTIRSGSMRLRYSNSCKSSVTAIEIASSVFSLAVVAPRIALIHHSTPLPSAKF